MNILRTTLVAALAIVSAAGVIAISEIGAHALYSGPALFGAATVGYFLGTLTGTALATLLGARLVAAGVPLLLGALATFNFVSFPHPLWFAPLAVAALAAGWVAGRWLGSRVRLAHEGAR